MCDVTLGRLLHGYTKVNPCKHDAAINIDNVYTIYSLSLKILSNYRIFEIIDRDAAAGEGREIELGGR